MGTELRFSTTFHPQMDGQSERVIQVVEDMLRACVLDFKGNWCDTPKPGVSVDYPSTRGILHVSRHEARTCVKWPVYPYNPNIYFIQKGSLFTILFNYNLYKNGSLAHNFYKNTREGRLGHFFASKAPDASHPQVLLRYLK